MGIKSAKGRIQDLCLKKVKPGETIFVLRAQDKIAPGLVRAWAAIAKESGTDPEKCFEAEQIALKMERWQDRRFPT